MTTYLAGPMAGCTDDEMFGWRIEATQRLKNVLDPTVRDYRGVHETEAQVKHIVHSDKDDIDNADVVLAYCPKPSYGTVMEILYAWERGKTVVIIVPPGALNSPWLRYHSNIIVETVEEACIYILQKESKKQIDEKGNTIKMSDNKFRYYNVVTTTVVKAKNKTEALEFVAGARDIDAYALAHYAEGERIPAAEAHELAITV